MIPGIDPKIDYAFKRIFGQERNRAILIHILNAILLLRKHAPVIELDLLNPFNDKETSSDKLSIVDLKARDQDGRHFNVEMQMLAHLAFPDRVLYYWSRLHPQQLHQGEDFTQLRPTFSICFLDEILFPELPGYHSCFQLREEKHPEVLFSEHLEIHLFELPKFQLAAENLHTSLEQWLYFLKNAVRLDSEAFPATLQAPEILQAFQELIMVTQDERDRARYEERFKAELDARSLRPALEETGRRKGRVEGELIGHIHAYQEVLQQPHTSRDELLALSLTELQQLAEILKRQTINSFGPPNGPA